MRGLLLVGSVLALSGAMSAAAMPAQAQPQAQPQAPTEIEDFFWRTSRDAIVHWAEDTVRMPVDPELVAFYGPRFQEALERAAAEWSVRPDIPLIAFDYAPTEADRQAAVEKRGNWIGLARTWEYHDELAITVSTSDASSGSVLAAQVWLNARRPLAVLGEDKVNPAEFYDLQGVLTHEFGHVLGLGEGPTQTLATMNPNFKRGETHQRTVDVIDEDAVMSLYDQVEALPTADVASCALEASHRGANAGGGAWAALAGLLGLARLAVGRAARRR